MEIVNALIAKIEFLSRQNCELSRRLEIYRDQYLKSKPRKRRTGRGA
jgi:hypothetical protein